MEIIKWKLIILIASLLILNVDSNFQGTFWHICDIHLNNSFILNDINRYGNYKDDSTFALFQSSVLFMKSSYTYPDFIIVNGDNSYHGKIQDYQLNASISNVTGELRLHFPATAILPSMGNHDINPANFISVNSSWCQNFYKFWESVLPNISNSDIETFKKGCFYTHSIDTKNSKQMIIVLNAILWYQVNSYVKTNSDPLNQFMWLKTKLRLARASMMKVFLVAHVSPGAAESNPVKFHNFHPQFNQRFLKLIQDYADVIDAGFFAHQHTDAFKIVYNSNNEPVIPLFLSPSVTPFNLWQLGSVNPSVRLYVWNGTSAGSRYHQYHTHLPTGNINSKSVTIEWKLEYVSNTLFPNLSAKSLDGFVSEFSLSSSPSFKSFFSYHLSGQPHDDETCPETSSCRCRFICGIRNIDYTSLDSCLTKCASKERKYDWAWLAVPIVLFLFVILFATFVFRRFYFLRRRLNPRYESF